MSPVFEMFDVVIVGAGLTGIAAAAQLQHSCPGKTFVILEARHSIGGTWDLFRYPGVRSDSDMYTFAYGFSPWTGRDAIVEGETIRDYIRETADDLDVAPHIRFHRRATSFAWDTRRNLWTVTVDHGGVEQHVRGRFVYLATGYFDYASGYDPRLPGEEHFRGQVVHAQEWPEQFDYSGQRVAIVGSGATGLTLAPAMVPEAEMVTLVQRSPTYVSIQDVVDPQFEHLSQLYGAEGAAIRLRESYAQRQQEMYRKAREEPASFKETVFSAIEERVGEAVREQHFTPTYEPWDQRLGVAPDADLFRAIATDRIRVVTGEIDHLTPDGITMRDGDSVDADLIVKATGLNLVLFGNAMIHVDGQLVSVGDCFTYKGLALSGVPNLFYGFGFVNASWTLRIELVNDYVCRVLRQMDEGKFARVTPTISAPMVQQPYVGGMTSGYMWRAAGKFPWQGDREPWTNPQNYEATLALLGRVDDPELLFEPAGRGE